MPVDIEKIFEDINSELPNIRYASSKELIAISKDNPSLVYPYFTSVIKLLAHKNKIICWSALQVIGNIARVDTENKITYLLPELYTYLNKGIMVTTNNTISALVSIAKAKPDKQDEICDQLIKVEKFNFDTSECRIIAMGKVLEGVSPFFHNLNHKNNFVDFAGRIAACNRPTIAKKAQIFLQSIV